MTTAEPTRTWSTTEAADLWRRGAARRAQILSVANEQMLQAAELRPGMRVLDIAAGTGDQSILAAQRVGPSGSVLATDISPTMLAAAADAAREANLSNLSTRVADASSLELPPDQQQFDAAICRFGLMFLTDLQAALTRIRGALRPGARFAALVWSTEASNPWLALQLSLIRDMDRMPSPPPSIARTTSLGAPGVLENALRQAGFSDVKVSAVATPREFDSLDEAYEAILSSSPAHGELTRALSAEERERYDQGLKRGLTAYLGADGRCSVPGEALLGVGTS